MYSEAQRRAHIFDLQTFLRRIQLDQAHVHPLVPDGIFGPETAAAVRDFQRRNGLLVTGTAGYETWTAIYQAYLLLLLGDTPQSPFPLPVLTGSWLPETRARLSLFCSSCFPRRCPIFPP